MKPYFLYFTSHSHLICLQDGDRDSKEKEETIYSCYYQRSFTKTFLRHILLYILHKSLMFLSDLCKIYNNSNSNIKHKSPLVLLNMVKDLIRIFIFVYFVFIRWVRKCQLFLCIFVFCIVRVHILDRCQNTSSSSIVGMKHPLQFRVVK